MPYLIVRPPSRAFKAHQRGLTLLESLVAVVVLALGVLGMLGVQMRSMAETQTGVRRAQAVRLIEDLSERLKSNPSAQASLNSYKADWNDSVTAAVDCSSAPCTPPQLASWDLKQWRSNVSEALPMGQAATFVSTDTTDPGARRMLGVMVAWRANEREVAGSSNYASKFSVDTAAIRCPSGRICHRVFLQP